MNRTLSPLFASESLKRFTKMTTSLRLLLALAVCGGATQAQAQSHEYINEMRSSNNTYFFLQTSVDGEFGKYVMSQNGAGAIATGSNSAAPVASSSATPSSVTENWKGYGIGTTLGLEIMKFFQVVVGHTLVLDRVSDNSIETLTGSRVNAGGRVVFTAPIANLEGGAGVLGSRMDYQHNMEQGGFYGSGAYYSLGMNYFASFHVSVYGEIKMETEHLVRDSGNTSVQSIDSNMTVMGLGVRIWL